MTQLQAITFDLWNTLLVEVGEGLILPRARLWQQLLRGRADLDLSVLEAAHRHALAQYQRAWLNSQQFRSEEAAAAACAHLELEPDGATLQALVQSFHDAGLASDLALVDGALEVLDAVRDSGLRTAIICDIGLTPSGALTERLRDFGLLDRLDVLAWSDVYGAYKPDPRIFRWTLAELGVGPAAACHVGDRLRTDVGGARATGMSSVRFRGVFDDPDDLPEAEHVIDHLAQLIELIQP